MSERINEWMSEGMNEWMSEGMNELTSEGMNEWMSVTCLVFYVWCFIANQLPPIAKSFQN